MIRRWWDVYPQANVAIATGAPGPDVLDVDVRPGGDGYASLGHLRRAGLLAGAFDVVQTPSTGCHMYFTSTGQRCSSLPRLHLDLKATGGYVLAPPSVVHGRAYTLAGRRDGTSSLDWTSVTELLGSPRPRPRPLSSPPGVSPGGIGSLLRWLACTPEGNRNRALYWAALRAIEDGFAHALDRLVPVAVGTGLSETEARRTIESARRGVSTGGAR